MGFAPSNRQSVFADGTWVDLAAAALAAQLPAPGAKPSEPYRPAVSPAAPPSPKSPTAPFRPLTAPNTATPPRTLPKGELGEACRVIPAPYWVGASQTPSHEEIEGVTRKWFADDMAGRVDGARRILAALPKAPKGPRMMATAELDRLFGDEPDYHAAKRDTSPPTIIRRGFATGVLPKGGRS